MHDVMHFPENTFITNRTSKMVINRIKIFLVVGSTNIMKYPLYIFRFLHTESLTHEISQFKESITETHGMKNIYTFNLNVND